MTETTNIKQLFLNSLKRGTGEAYLIMKNYPKIDFSKQIIKGVLNIYAYDGQSEGNRANFIFDIITISNQKDKIRKTVLNALAKEHCNTWNLTHLFALAKFYVQQNDEEARQAIYNRFLHKPIEGSDWVGYSEILELDGLKGLFFIAEKFGKYIVQNPDDSQDDYIIRHFQEKNKDLKIYNELEKIAKSNRYVNVYLDNIKRSEARWKINKTEPIKYIDLIDEILNSRHFISFRGKRKITKKELNLVAKRLVNETDNYNIEKLLKIFSFYKFPFESDLILNFAKQKPTGKNRIVEYAMNALQHLKSKNIRAFALDKIINSKKPIEYLEILVANYQHGDFKILIDIAKKIIDKHKIEQLAGIFTDIYKANKTKECKEPLEILYNKMNCAIHRNVIIEILIENKVLSDKIKMEIKHDSYLETRNLTYKKDKSRQ